MRPSLVDEVRSTSGRVDTTQPAEWRRVLDPGSAGAIRDAMQQAVDGPLAASFAGGAKVPGVPTAGKSGTAELGGPGEPHSWFIGFAPVQQPRIAIAVVIENGGLGREQAVPIAGRLMRMYLGLKP